MSMTYYVIIYVNYVNIYTPIIQVYSENFLAIPLNNNMSFFVNFRVFLAIALGPRLF